MGGGREGLGDGARRVHAVFSPAYAQDPWISGKLVVCVWVDAVNGSVLDHGVGVVEGGTAAGVGDETSIIVSVLVSMLGALGKETYLSSPR